MSSLISHNRSCPTVLIILFTLLWIFSSSSILLYEGNQYCIQYSRCKWVRDIYSDKTVFSGLFYVTSLTIPHIWFTFFSAIGNWANVYIGASIIAPRSCFWVLMTSSLPTCVYVLCSWGSFPACTLLYLHWISVAITSHSLLWSFFCCVWGYCRDVFYYSISISQRGGEMCRTLSVRQRVT